MDKTLAEVIRDTAKTYASYPEITPEIRLITRTLLLLAHIIENGQAKDVDCGFFLKSYIAGTKIDD